MTRTRRALAALLTVLATVLTVPALGQPAHADRSTTQVVYFNLYDATVKPKRLFTAFSSAPTMKVRTWRDWGEATAVGRGTWESSCASCAPPRTRKAVVTLSRIRSCEGGMRYYSRAVVEVAKPDRGETRTTYHLSTGCPPPPATADDYLT